MRMDRLLNADHTERALVAPRVSLGSTMVYHGGAARRLSCPHRRGCRSPCSGTREPLRAG
jgi:hypothetical protein